MDRIEYRNHVADPLRSRLSSGSYSIVAQWLRDVAAYHAFEDDDGNVIGPSVAWLAEAVTFHGE